jgi:hypothetical protein
LKASILQDRVLEAAGPVAPAIGDAVPRQELGLQLGEVLDIANIIVLNRY